MVKINIVLIKFIFIINILGWLGIILGSKMFINFKKYDWEECIRRLRAEILSLQKKSAKQQKQPKKLSKTPPLNNNNMISSNEKLTTTEDSKPEAPLKQNKLEWKEEDVDSWIHEKKFSQTLIENIKPCNGKILYQLFIMCKNAPEFFYSSLRNESNNNISLKDLALFSYELNNLFNEENS
jgi:hypothetical protein